MESEESNCIEAASMIRKILSIMRDVRDYLSTSGLQLALRNEIPFIKPALMDLEMRIDPPIDACPFVALQKVGSIA